jgi:hypothetical protein
MRLVRPIISALPFCYKCRNLAFVPKRFRAAGDCATRSLVFHYTAHNGSAHACHACRRDQRYALALVKRHVAGRSVPNHVTTVRVATASLAFLPPVGTHRGCIREKHEAAWKATTRRLASGTHGTALTSFGPCVTCVFRSAACGASQPPASSSSHLNAITT